MAPEEGTRSISGQGEDPGSTLPDETSHPLDHKFRVVLYIVLGLTLLVGVGGFLGVKTGTTEAEGGGLRLEVDHDQVTRAGLPGHLAIRVSSTDGSPLPERLSVAITASYLPRLDEHGLSPDPDSSWSNGNDRVWEFRPPAGEDQLEVIFDGRLEPSLRGGRSARVGVVIEGSEVVQVHFQTWVLP